MTRWGKVHLDLLSSVSYFVKALGPYGIGCGGGREVNSQVSCFFLVSNLSLVIFGFLYSPISIFTSIGINILSRKHEFEADSYAAKTTCDSKQLITSLKKLSRANLSNLTPHPIHVFLHYSHPPLLQRINTLSTEKK